MYSKDFILRMIEMIGDLIAGILELIRKGDFQQASQALDNVYFDFLKQDASSFRTINKEILIEELTNKHNFTNAHLEILSELFIAEAELFYAKGNQAGSVAFYEKSLILLSFVIKSSKTLSIDKQARLVGLENRFAQLMANVSKY